MLFKTLNHDKYFEESEDKEEEDVEKVVTRAQKKIKFKENEKKVMYVDEDIKSNFDMKRKEFETGEYPKDRDNGINEKGQEIFVVEIPAKEHDKPEGIEANKSK